MLLIASALVLGFLHGLGADHLLAIASLAVGGDRTVAVARARALGIAARFAAGHALVLALGAGAVVLIGGMIPAWFERGGELAAGFLLIVLGAAGVAAALSGRVYAHAHPHSHDPGAWHVHIGGRIGHSAAHSALPTLVGAAFAVGSLRALSTLAPFGAAAGAAGIPQVLLLIALFAAGILISMSLFGVALARTLSTRVVAGLGRVVAVTISAASIGLGAFWILANW